MRLRLQRGKRIARAKKRLIAVIVNVPRLLAKIFADITLDPAKENANNK